MNREEKMELKDYILKYGYSNVLKELSKLDEEIELQKGAKDE